MPDAPLPDDATLAAVIGQARRARSTISTVGPYRAQVERRAAKESMASPFMRRCAAITTIVAATPGSVGCLRGSTLLGAE